MRPLRELAVVFCGLLLVGRTTWAQQAAEAEKIPAENEIRRLIKSDEPREMAWGAHYALAARNQKLNADLLAAAEQWQSPTDDSAEGASRTKITPEEMDKRDGMAAVLDALIQLHVALTPETLRGLASDFPNYVAVLITRLPISEVRELSFDLFREMPERGYSLQYVAAALLARSPPVGYAAELMAGIEVSADIAIVQPGSSGFGRGFASCCGAGSGDREGWPKFGNYQFAREKSERAALLFSEPQPVYVTRGESTHDQGIGCGGLGLEREDRRKFLAYMLKIKPEEIGWETRFSKMIVYRSPAQVDLEVRRLIAGEQEKYKSTAQQLVAAGLIEESEAESSIPLLKLHWQLDFDEGKQPEIERPMVLPPRVVWSENPFD